MSNLISLLREKEARRERYTFRGMELNPIQCKIVDIMLDSVLKGEDMIIDAKAARFPRQMGRTTALAKVSELTGIPLAVPVRALRYMRRDLPHIQCIPIEDCKVHGTSSSSIIIDEITTREFQRRDFEARNIFGMIGDGPPLEFHERFQEEVIERLELAVSKPKRKIKPYEIFQ